MGWLVKGAQNLASPPSLLFSDRERECRGAVLEGTVRERERLVADGGEGKGKGRRGIDICSGGRRMGEEGKGVETSAEIG